MQVGCRGLETCPEQEVGEKGRGSAQVALLVLDGFLDAEKHGGEPLVQP